MNEIETDQLHLFKDVGGFRLYTADARSSRIVRVEYGVPGRSASVTIGQKVESNGRFDVPAGRRGVVISLHEPGTDRRTSDIIEVQFEGYPGSHDMKFKDLNL